MAESPTLVVQLEGKEYRLRARDLTARDAKDFRGAVGVSLTEVFVNKSFDLDVVAGIVWLARRKTERGLPYEAVADAITYDSELTFGDPGTAVEPTGPDPEA